MYRRFQYFKKGFNLILTGEEVYSGEIRAQAGTTRTTLTVQGAYANPDMETQIENIWEQLNDLIGETLQQLPQAMPVTAQEVVEPQPAQPQTGDDQAERVTILRKRLDQLMEALIGPTSFTEHTGMFLEDMINYNSTGLDGVLIILIL